MWRKDWKFNPKNSHSDIKKENTSSATEYLLVEQEGLRWGSWSISCCMCERSVKQSGSYLR